MSRAAMQMALEALEERYVGALRDRAIEALEAALAEPEQKPQTTHWEGCEAVHPECKKENT